MPSLRARWEGAAMLDPLCPGGGFSQKTVPPPWQTRRNFPERFPPLFTLHMIPVFAQWVPNVTVPQPPTTVLPPGMGSEVWAALPTADPWGQSQPCQTLPCTAGPQAAPHQPPGPALTRCPDLRPPPAWSRLMT